MKQARIPLFAVATAALAVLGVGSAVAVSHGSGTPAPAATAAAGASAPAAGNAAADAAWRPPGPHGGIDLNVLVITDGSTPVEAIRQELVTEGLPVTVIDLRKKDRKHITAGLLARSQPVRGGNFDGIVLPSADAAGLSAAELSALARYEKSFGVREVDAYTPPMANVGMTAPVYSGPLTGSASVTSAGASDGFGYLNQSFPFSGGISGQAPFGYLASPLAGSTPLVDVQPAGGSAGALVWQYEVDGSQRLGIGFGYGSYAFQFHFLAHGIVSWLTRGVNLGDYRNYLDFAFDDMFLGDSQWSTIGHCTPTVTPCPKGTPMTGTIRMVPADVTYLVQWEKQHDFTIEWLYNGGASARFAVNGVDALLQATKPVAKDFFWVNHTYTHAYMGCVQNFRMVPWQCARTNGQIDWGPADSSLINSQIEENFAWAKQNGIPYEPGVVASGEYSGLRLFPQQPIDNPNLVQAMSTDHINWIAMDASAEPAMRSVGVAFGVPRIPVDVGEDAQSIAEEVSEFNWYNDSKADGGSGVCQGSKTTACLKPLTTAGWQSVIVPTQAQIVLQAMLDNNPRPVFMHQSNLTADRLGYPVMDAVLSAYRAVYGASAPVDNVPMSGAGVAMRDQQLWSQALSSGKVSAWVQGSKLIVDGPPGMTAPVTVPDGTSGAGFASSYAGEQSGFTTLTGHPMTLNLPSAPYR